jgi:hypothetical protein
MRKIILISEDHTKENIEYLIALHIKTIADQIKRSSSLNDLIGYSIELPKKDYQETLDSRLPLYQLEGFSQADVQYCYNQGIPVFASDFRDFGEHARMHELQEVLDAGHFTESVVDEYRVVNRRSNEIREEFAFNEIDSHFTERINDDPNKNYFLIHRCGTKHVMRLKLRFEREGYEVEVINLHEPRGFVCFDGSILNSLDQFLVLGLGKNTELNDEQQELAKKFPDIEPAYNDARRRISPGNIYFELDAFPRLLFFGTVANKGPSLEFLSKSLIKAKYELTENLYAVNAGTSVKALCFSESSLEQVKHTLEHGFYESLTRLVLYIS